MARLVMCSAEIMDHVTTNVGSPDGYTPGTTPTTTNTTSQRDGRACWSCAGTSVNTSYRAVPFTAPALGSTVFARTRLRFSALPSATKKIVALLTSADGALVSVRLTSAGKLQLWNDAASAQIGSDSTLTLAVDTYYRIQLSVLINTGAIDTAEMRVVYEDDPTAVEESVSGSSLTISDTHAARVRSGWIDAPGVTSTMLVNDIAVNDSTGTKENTWLGAGRIFFSRPVWSAGWGASPTSMDCSGTLPSGTMTVDGGINMANGVNNYPPRGVADHTTAGHAADPDQIRMTGTISPKWACELFSQFGLIGDVGFAPVVLTNFNIGDTATNEAHAQSFYLNGTLRKFSVYLVKTNTPTDDLIVDLVEDNAGSPTGAIIESWTMPASSYNASFPDVAFTLTYPIGGTNRLLWVRITRAGALDNVNYFQWRSSTSVWVGPGCPASKRSSGVWATQYTNHELQVFTAQGVHSPKVMVGWICHGEAAATGTKTYTAIGVNTGSGGTSSAAGNIGNDAGAAGTYPTNWTWTGTPPYYKPSTAPAGGRTVLGGPWLTMGTVTSSTAFSLVCCAGVYFEHDENYGATWQRFQKTADSTFWWGKQAMQDTTVEAGTDGQTIVTAPSESWLMYPEPQVDAGGNLPTTTVVVDTATLSSGYTSA